MTIELIRQLVIKILATQPREYSARLKQRLSAATIEQGLGYFDESSFGYRKFKDFLTAELSDLVHIEQPSSQGDILVSLKSTEAASASSHARQVQLPLESPPPIRGDVWQAFTNLDPKRRRYLNKVTHAIRHYINETASPARAEVDASSAEFIEIQPIETEEQQRWMGEFLASQAHLPATTKAKLEEITLQQYGAESNKAFAGSLGPLAAQWRHFRAGKVFVVLKTWATSHSVPIESLLAKPKVLTPSTSAETKNSGLVSTSEARNRINTLISLLSDEDLDRLVLPVLVSTVLIKTRL